jgi:hypothetical protein
VVTERPWDWDDDVLARFVAAARASDFHAILDIPPGEDPEAALDRDVGREYEHGWERLLALYVAKDHFRHRADGIIYSYAEDRYFRYDDDGMVMEGLMVDLAMLHSVNDFGLRDEQLACEYWQAALGGPYPEGAREGFTKIEPSLDSEMRARLALLMAP